MKLLKSPVLFAVLALLYLPALIVLSRLYSGHATELSLYVMTTVGCLLILGLVLSWFNLNSQNVVVKRAAERIAMNTPLQGSAADLIKLAMIRVHHELRRNKMQTKLLLQVHDELIVEAPMAESDEAKDLLRTCMNEVMTLKVPLTVEVGMGETWAEAH